MGVRGGSGVAAITLGHGLVVLTGPLRHSLCMPTTPQYDTAALDRIDQYERDLMSGLVFRRHAAGNRSEIGYRPPTRSDDWAKCVRVLALNASLNGDRQTKLMAAAIKALPLHMTPGETRAKMYDAVADELERDFHDTIKAASPEPGRYSDRHKPYTLEDRLVALAALTWAGACFPVSSLPGLGWCAQAILDRTPIYGQVLMTEDLAKKRA